MNRSPQKIIIISIPPSIYSRGFLMMCGKTSAINQIRNSGEGAPPIGIAPSTHMRCNSPWWHGFGAVAVLADASRYSCTSRYAPSADMRCICHMVSWFWSWSCACYCREIFMHIHICA
ncbi:uncharacterized protein LOC119367603 [Triticum dicoccoides]|uniref:uncharacterized protein LOC119367603 n=1 Tax=Triticum dicoccoides TaxID=85692 RepID=UPI00188F2D32|nr:uncharacterized protein LOC119367603 [Triticum dicoccoides]